jgi:predicted amidohydrolase
MIAPYVVAACQISMRPVYKGADTPFRPECIKENLDRVCAMVEQAAKEHQAKLAVFPEFCVQGYALSRRLGTGRRAVTWPRDSTNG